MSFGNKIARANTYDNLRRMYEHYINVNHISEKLTFCKPEDDALKVKDLLYKNDYDVIGVEQEGMVIGYIEREELKSGICKDYIHIFRTSDLISDSTPLIELFPIFKRTSRVFILEKNRVNQIVTTADMQKSPVRILLFGLISLLEMHLLEIIREHYTEDSWRDSISSERLEKAEKLLVERKQRNEAIDLADCLELSDKITLVIKKQEIKSLLGFKSRREAEKIINKIKILRDKLAHSQDLVTGSSWSEIIEIVEKCEHILFLCEGIDC